MVHDRALLEAALARAAAKGKFRRLRKNPGGKIPFAPPVFKGREGMLEDCSGGEPGAFPSEPWRAMGGALWRPMGWPMGEPRSL